MRVNREHLLAILDIAAVGLTRREILEGSSCYVFTKEHLVTFNGEVLTKCDTPLEGITGGVPAEDFRKVLHKFPDDEVEIVRKGEEVRIKGKRRTAGITRTAKVALPYDVVPPPGKTREAPEWLLGALLQAARVCGHDETKPRTTEVHVAGDRIEACDNLRLFRYARETGFEKPSLIPGLSVEAIGGLTIARVKEGKGWVHFKTTSNHLVSVRCSEGKYPAIDELMTLSKPKRISLPPNLADILHRASVMHDEKFNAVVGVRIEDAMLTLTAKKESGWYRESQKIKYTGDPLAFEVHPKFLEDILSKTRKVFIGDNRMKIEAGEATFVVCLEMVGE